jgi:N-acyl-D-amino-acid deacylase
MMRGAFAVLVLAALQTPTPAPFDLVIRHGTVFDGTGRAPVAADVAVRGGYVVRVQRGLARGVAEIDASGLYVAPGFINIHSHAQPDGLPTAANMLTQGVTTEIINSDGAGPLDIAAQLTDLQARGLAVNVGAFIGFNSIWTHVVGREDRVPTKDEIARMQQILVAGLGQGAWGVSAGLDYKPAYFAKTEDVIAIVSAAREWRTNFINHDRLTPESNYSSRAGVAETLAIGEKAGLLPVVTHMKAQGHEQNTAPALLKLMQRGRYAAADVYPYLAGQTSLDALIIPGWAQEGGREATLKRFADPAMRAKIIAEAERAMQLRFGGAAGVTVTTVRRKLTDVMEEEGVSAGEAVVRLLERGPMGMIAAFGVESDLVAILKHPSTSVACDCGAVARQATHPRYYGSYPRVLGRYVREQNVLTWEGAIRKMSGLPAATVGMVDRGLLAPGMAADIVVFDPATIVDHATFEDPTAPSRGIVHVLVNGTIALRDGSPTGMRAGAALRRSAHMPGRAMPSPDPRRLVARGDDATLDVRQSARDVRASGTMRVSINGTMFRAAEWGVVQVAPQWGSVTGIATDPTGAEHPFIAVVDGRTLVVEIPLVGMRRIAVRHVGVPR